MDTTQANFQASGGDILTNAINGLLNTGFTQANNAMNSRRAFRNFKKQSDYQAQQSIKLQQAFNDMALKTAFRSAVQDYNTKVMLGINPDAGIQNPSIQNFTGATAPSPNQESQGVPSFNANVISPTERKLLAQQFESQSLANQRARIENFYLQENQIADLKQKAVTLEKAGEDVRALRQSIAILEDQRPEQLKALQLANQKTEADITKVAQDIDITKNQEERAAWEFEAIKPSKIIRYLDELEETQGYLDRRSVGLPKDAPREALKVLQDEDTAILMWNLLSDNDWLSKLQRNLKSKSFDLVTEIARNHQWLSRRQAYELAVAIQYHMKRVEEGGTSGTSQSDDLSSRMKQSGFSWLLSNFKLPFSNK